MAGSDGRIDIDTRIDTGNVEHDMRQMQKEVKAMQNAFKTAEMKAMMPFRKEIFKVQKNMLNLSHEMGNYTGTNRQFMSSVQQLGKEHKKATDNMINNNKMMGMSMIQTAGMMLNMTTQAQRISDNFDRMGNPMYKVNKAGLAIANSLNQIANRGNAAVLALKMLGPNAKMKDLLNMQMMINQGLMRFAGVALVAGVAATIFYSSLHKKAMETNKKYAEAFKGMKESMSKAFEPLVEVFAKIMTPVFNFIAKIGEMITKFNEAHPVLAKIIAGFLVLLPAITFILAPLAIGIGLFGGLSAAMGFVWVAIGPIVTGFLAMMGTVLLVTAVIVGLVAGFMYLWKTNEGFRNAVITAWSAIKTAAISVWQGLIAVITPAFQAIVAFVKVKLDQIKAFWDANGQQIIQALTNVWNVIKTIFSVAMAIIIPILGVAWAIIKSVIMSTWNAIKSIINGALNVIQGIIKVFAGIFTGDFSKVWEGIKQIFKGALQILWGWINLYFIGKFLGPLKGFASTAKSLLKSAWNFIKGIFTNTLNAIKSFVTGSFNAVNRTISSVMNAIRQVISSIWNSIRSTINTVTSTIKSIVSRVFNGLKSTVSTAMSNVKNAIVKGWNAAKSFLTSINLKTIGKNIIQGLINGIGSMVGAVTKKISDVAGSIKDGITGLLDINSPSRWMRDEVGKMIPAGIAVGINADAGMVESAMKNVANATMSVAPQFMNKPASLNTQGITDAIVGIMSGKGDININNYPQNANFNDKDILRTFQRAVILHGK